MPKFLVTRDWSGYSRGYTTYEVEAESAEEARDNYYSGEQVEHEVVRDDTETSGFTVEEI